MKKLKLKINTFFDKLMNLILISKQNYFKWKFKRLALVLGSFKTAFVFEYLNHSMIKKFYH